MRAITLHRPWPYVILRCGKRVENRPWKPWAVIMGQTIALHAGKGWDQRAERYLPHEFGTVEEPRLIRQEGLVGTAKVTGWIASDAQVLKTGESSSGLPKPVVYSLLKSPYFFGPYGWVLEDVRELVSPLACRGKQGLWHVPVDLLPSLI